MKRLMKWWLARPTLIHGFCILWILLTLTWPVQARYDGGGRWNNNYLINLLYGSGDPDSYFGFDAADAWLLTLGGVQVIDASSAGILFLELGHATDTTVTRKSAGDLSVEGNKMYRVDGNDVDVADGGTGVSTLADGGLLIGNAGNDVEVVAAGATTEILVGGGASTAPVWTTATGTGAPVRAASPTLTDIITDQINLGGTGVGTRALVNIQPSSPVTSGVVQEAILMANFRPSSSATTQIAGIYMGVTTPDEVFTTANYWGLFFPAITKGTSHTITSACQACFASPPTATNKTTLLLGAQAIPSGTYEIYSSGSANSYFAGDLTLNADLRGSTFSDQQSHLMAAKFLHILADPLCGYVWTTPATTEQDMTVENHDATYTNIESADQDYEGMVYHVTLDGSDEYFSVADHADFTLIDGGNDDADCSFIAWVKIYADGNQKTIASKYDDTNSQLEWELFVDSAEKVNLRFYDESAGNTAYEGRITDSAVSAGWHLIVVTYAASSQGESASDTMIIYSDGAVAANSASDGGGTYVDKEDKGQAVWIGAQGENDAYTNGWTGDVGTFWIDQSTLSAATVHELYVATRGYYAQ